MHIRTVVVVALLVASGLVPAAAQAAPKDLVVTVAVDPLKSDGKAWDAAGLPDVAGTITIGSRQELLPKHEERSWAILVVRGIDLPNGTPVSITLVDKDMAADDAIGSGTITWSGKETTGRIGAAMVTLRAFAPGKSLPMVKLSTDEADKFVKPYFKKKGEQLGHGAFLAPIGPSGALTPIAFVDTPGQDTTYAAFALVEVKGYGRRKDLPVPNNRMDQQAVTKVLSEDCDGDGVKEVLVDTLGVVPAGHMGGSPMPELAIVKWTGSEFKRLESLESKFGGMGAEEIRAALKGGDKPGVAAQSEVVVVKVGTTKFIKPRSADARREGDATLVTWSINDPSKAEISIDGHVKGIAAGSVIVTETNSKGEVFQHPVTVK